MSGLSLMFTPDSKRLPSVCEMEHAPHVDFFSISPIFEVNEQNCYSPVFMGNQFENIQENCSARLHKRVLDLDDDHAHENQQCVSKKRRIAKLDNQLILKPGTSPVPKGFGRQRQVTSLLASAPLFQNISSELKEFCASSVASLGPRRNAMVLPRTPSPSPFDYSRLEIEAPRLNIDDRFENAVNEFSAMSNSYEDADGVVLPWNPAVYSQSSLQIASSDDGRINSRLGHVQFLVFLDFTRRHIHIRIMVLPIYGFRKVIKCILIILLDP